MEMILFKDIVVIFGVSVAILLVCHRLNIPSIVGFLLTGLICGPHGVGLIKDTHNVQMLADLGILLLLFSVGMELSLKKMLAFKRFFLANGFLQITLTVLCGIVIGLYSGNTFNQSLFLGFLLSLSSTAIVLREIDARKETETPHSRVVLATLIFQDIVAVPMLLITPFLTSNGAAFDPAFLLLIVKGVIILVVVFIAAERVIPRLLHLIARTRSRELFLLSVLTICFSVAWLASEVGLSLSLGAFLAGLIISESEFRHEAIGSVLPFQGVFISFFFVSIGMLLDVTFLTVHPVMVVTVAAAILAMKAVIATATTFALGMPLRTSILSGVALSQIGEFSFVLINAGKVLGIVTDIQYQQFLAVSLLTMAVTPYLIGKAPWIAQKLSGLPFPFFFKDHPLKESKGTPAPEDHVIIIGYGVSGKNVAHTCKAANIPYAIIEMNPDTVKEERRQGEPIHYGDATHESLLQHVNVANARAAAVLVNDALAALRIVETLRRLNPSLYIAVRTRFVQEVEAFYHLGANDVIPDEFGTSVEIFTRVLRHFRIPPGTILRVTNELRYEGYDMQRSRYKKPESLMDLTMQEEGVQVETFEVTPTHPLANKTLGESKLREDWGLNLLMIKRGDATLTALSPETKILPHDLLVVVSSQHNLTAAKEFFGD